MDFDSPCPLFSRRDSLSNRARLITFLEALRTFWNFSSASRELRVTEQPLVKW
jgi:hypothetical protein